MTHPTSIILDPKQMFDTLNELETATNHIVKSLDDLAQQLQEVATLTYAQGFGELIKKAERDINQVGHAVVAANNSFNTTCAEIVNHLVEKFAPQGARSSYNTPPFQRVHIRVNTAERAAIYPPDMEALFNEYNEKIGYFERDFFHIEDVYKKTKNFWVGTSADRTRHNFKTIIVPLFKNLGKVLFAIFKHGEEWIQEAVNYEANISTP